MKAERLIADIGGTNTRVGLARDGTLVPRSVRSFRNRDHDSAEAILSDYLDGCGHAPTEAAIAAAGPATGDAIRLTNRDWRISRDRLSHGLGIPAVALMNDLQALGHALPRLTAPADLLPVHEAPAFGGQSLVVGIGTGFNVSPVLWSKNRPSCTLSAEMGHAALPSDIASEADKLMEIGPSATIEDVFSGRGYLHLLGAVADRPVPDAETARACLASDPALADRFHALFGQWLGLLIRSLTLAYLPRAGIAFSGSVARALLGRKPVVKAIRQTPAPHVLGPGWLPPLGLVTRDDAALTGLAAVTLAPTRAR